MTRAAVRQPPCLCSHEDHQHQEREDLGDGLEKWHESKCQVIVYVQLTGHNRLCWCPGYQHPSASGRPTKRQARSKNARKVLDRHVSEADFMRQVIEFAELQGWTCYHTHDSRRSNEGYPDLTMVRPPQLLYAELKSEKGKATEAQLEWLRILDACDGVVSFLWRPSSWAEIERVLARPVR